MIHAGRCQTLLELSRAAPRDERSPHCNNGRVITEVDSLLQDVESFTGVDASCSVSLLKIMKMMMMMMMMQMMTNICKHRSGS